MASFAKAEIMLRNVGQIAPAPALGKSQGKKIPNFIIPSKSRSDIDGDFLSE
jgi:hypothetical protein